MAIRNDILFCSARGGQLPDDENDRLERIEISGGDRYAISFENASAQEVIWTFPELPASYQGGTLKLEVLGISDATSGNVDLSAAVEAVTPGDSLDVGTAVSFDTANTASTAVAATAGHTFVSTVTLTNKDGAVKGDALRIKLTRSASDTCTGTFKVLAAKVYEDVSEIDLTQADNVNVTALNDIPAATLAFIDPTSSIQTQINSKQATINVTASKALVSDGSGAVAASAVTSTELGHVAGVTSAIQTQLDSKAATSSLGSAADNAETDFVSTAPATTGRNLITAGAANAIPLTVKGAASQSVDLLQVKNNSDTVHLRVQNDGTVKAAGDVWSFGSNGDFNLLTGSMRLYSAGGAITSRQPLQIGTSNEIGAGSTPLLLKANASQSVDILKINDSTDTTIAGVDSDGRFFGDGSQLTNLPSAGGSTDTLTSASTVNLDFNGASNAKLSIGHNVTFTTSNKAANKSKVLTIFGHASNTYNLAYPSDWKNCGGTTLPSTIAANATYQFRITVFGTAETDVVVEFVNGVGVATTLTTPATCDVYKGSSSSISFSNMKSGPNIGFCYITMTATIGYFTYGGSTYNASGTLWDGMTAGQYSVLSFFTPYGSVTSLGSVTWYSNPSNAIESGTFTLQIQDAINTTTKYVSISSYGADEVQQLDWTNTGAPTAPTGGFYTLSHSSYGTTSAIDTQGGTSAAQSALNTLMGSAAPTVGGGGATLTFTFSNGALAHTDTAEMTVNTSTPAPNDGIYNAGFSFVKVQTGDGSSLPDLYNGSWEYYAVGTVTFDGVVVAKQTSGGSGASPVIGGVTYTLTDSGGSFTLTASDFADHGTISATPSIGFALTGTMSTTTAGNS